MTSKDAYMFPIIASCVLFGLYILVKLINKDLLSVLLNIYFMIIGTGSFALTIQRFIGGFFSEV